jgi:hypothetical protein
MHAFDAYDPKAVGGGGGGHACLMMHPKTTMSRNAAQGGQRGRNA